MQKIYFSPAQPIPSVQLSACPHSGLSLKLGHIRKSLRLSTLSFLPYDVIAENISNLDSFSITESAATQFTGQVLHTAVPPVLFSELCSHARQCHTICNDISLYLVSVVSCICPFHVNPPIQVIRHPVLHLTLGVEFFIIMNTSALHIHKFAHRLPDSYSPDRHRQSCLLRCTLCRPLFSRQYQHDPVRHRRPSQRR